MKSWEDIRFGLQRLWFSWWDSRCIPWLACRRHGRCYTHSGDVETGCDSPVMPGRRCPKCGMYMPPKAKVPRRCFECGDRSPELHTVHNGGPVYSCKGCMSIITLKVFERLKADGVLPQRPCC